MALQQDYHQFSAADMPEIRNIRSIMLKSLRLKEKMSVPRLNKITKAIVTDFNINKLCPEIKDWRDQDKECPELIRDVDRAIKRARDNIHDCLWHILDLQCIRYEKLAKSKASTKEILTAATDMATKYYGRSKVSKKSKKPSSRKNLQASASPIRAISISVTRAWRCFSSVPIPPGIRSRRPRSKRCPRPTASSV